MMSSPEVITLISDSDDNDSENDNNHENSGSCNSNSGDTDAVNYVKTATTIDLMKPNHNPLVQKSDRVPFIHTTKLEDMLIFKKKFHICIPNNVIKRIEIESKPKIFRERKTRRLLRRVKAIARVRYNIRKINEQRKLKEEAIKNNYYDKLNMCKPITIDLIHLKYYIIDLKYCCKPEVILNAQKCDVDLGSEKYNRKCCCNAKKKCEIQFKTFPHITMEVNDDNLAKEIFSIDSEYVLPLKTYESKKTLVWCSKRMERILFANIVTKRDKKMPKRIKTDAFEVNIVTRNSYKCEYYLIGKSGDIESYYFITDSNFIKATEIKLLADIKSRGYSSVTCIEIKACCWYERNKILNTCAVPQTAKRFMKSNHSCRLTICECCCNPFKSLKNNSSSFTLSSHKGHDFGNNICKQISQLSTADKHKRKRNESFELEIPQAIRYFKKVKTVEDINREFDEKNNPVNNLNPIDYEESSVKPTDNDTNENIINNDNVLNPNINSSNEVLGSLPKSILSDILTNGLDKNLKYQNLCSFLSSSTTSFKHGTPESTSKDKKSNAISDLPNKILNNSEVQTIIRSILEQFKNIKLIIGSDGQLAAHIDKTLQGNDLSPADLQMLGNIMIYAQEVVNSLKLTSATYLPVKESPVNYVNIAPKISGNIAPKMSMPEETVTFVQMCEISSKIAKSKNKYYSLSLKFMRTQTAKNNNSLIYFFDSKECSSSLHQVKLFGSERHLLKTAETMQPTANVGNIKPTHNNNNNTNFAGAKLNQHSAKVDQYIMVNPTPALENIARPTPDLIPMLQHNSPQVIPLVIPPNFASSVAVPTNFTPVIMGEVGNVVSLPSNINLNPIYVSVNKLKINNNIVSDVLSTNVHNNSTSNTNLQNISSNRPNILVRSSKNVSRKKTMIPHIEDVIGSSIDKTNYPQSRNVIGKKTQLKQKSNIENNDQSNIDWESKIVDSLIIKDIDNLGLSSEQLPENHESVMPKITQVFSLNTADVVSLSDSD